MLPLAGALESQNMVNNNVKSDHVLKKGMNSQNIIEIQKWLKINGFYEGKIDGYFGPYTEGAVKKFQIKAGITANGQIGIETLRAMKKWGFKTNNSMKENTISQEQNLNQQKSLSKPVSAEKESKSIETKKRGKREITVNKEDNIRTNNNQKRKNYRKNYNQRSQYKKSYRKNQYKRYYKSNRGKGDCWDNSAALYGRLTASGQKARIIQYRTSLSSRHRSVQVYKNGRWVDYDYKGNGYAKTYFATKNKPGMSVIT